MARKRFASRSPLRKISKFKFNEAASPIASPSEDIFFKGSAYDLSCLVKVSRSVANGKSQADRNKGKLFLRGKHLQVFCVKTGKALINANIPTTEGNPWGSIVSTTEHPNSFVLLLANAIENTNDHLPPRYFTFRFDSWSEYHAAISKVVPLTDPEKSVNKPSSLSESSIQEKAELTCNARDDNSIDREEEKLPGLLSHLEKPAATQASGLVIDVDHIQEEASVLSEDSAFYPESVDAFAVNTISLGERNK